MDYFERAKRLEEIPQLQKFYDDERLVMQQVWEQQEQERVSNMDYDNNWRHRRANAQLCVCHKLPFAEHCSLPLLIQDSHSSYKLVLQQYLGSKGEQVLDHH